MAQFKKLRFYMHLIFFKVVQCYKNKPQMAQFLKFKFLIKFKLNFNGDQLKKY